MTQIPRLVVAAPASGSGKTTVATGLMAAFAARGVAVSPHKVGPDYIDPGYHALATGRPGRNLDAYLCGPERIAPLLLHGAAGCELAVVEGVMGLFDGAAGHGELGSTAHVARLLASPVVLVVDAARQSRSVAALVHGFASWDPRVRLGGVVLNRVGSDRHEEMLREALDEAGVPVLGALRRDDALRVPSRHLGLVPAAERHAEAAAWIAAAAQAVRTGCDLGALWALARSAPPLSGDRWDPTAALARGEVGQGAGSDGTAVGVGGTGSADTGFGRAGVGAPGSGDTGFGRAGAGGTGPGARRATRRPVVAVAAGAAFSFAYPENAELLAAAGAEIAELDPLRDEKLPEGTAGLVLGGGFPELHAPQLAANASLRASVAAFRGPIAAECAGLLYLVREVDGVPMCGVLDATATMTDRLTLGYREAVALGDSVLARQGTRLRGHEFHRTAVTPAAGAAEGVHTGGPGDSAQHRVPAWGFTGVQRRTEGFADARVHASYLHVHWAAEPSLARRFVERCSG